MSSDLFLSDPSAASCAAVGHTSLSQRDNSEQHQESQLVRFVPAEPRSLSDTGLTEHEVEALILKLLLTSGTERGRQLGERLCLPRPIIQEALERLRSELLIAIKSSSGLEDFLFQLTEAGYDKARRLAQQNSYAGVAPVPLESYLESVQAQSLQGSSLSEERLATTFGKLRISELLLSQLGQAINDGRGLFLHGPPGNGKTSIAELVVGTYGEYIWIPNTITIDGELIRLFDARCHQAVQAPQLQQASYDRRWILIHRPTIIGGGELTMSQLELQYNTSTGVCEAPLQMRANCGALVVDDFGRQRMPTSELLNRLIVPMEKQQDYLSLASGRQVVVPFDMLLVFSTNLEPRELVDEAFLRRIPYKIEVTSPTEAEFRKLFLSLARDMEYRCDETALTHLLETHFKSKQRPMRFCHPRDLLRQIRNYCEFHHRPQEVTKENIEVAVQNYFAGF